MRLALPGPPQRKGLNLVQQLAKCKSPSLLFNLSILISVNKGNWNSSDISEMVLNCDASCYPVIHLFKMFDKALFA